MYVGVLMMSNVKDIDFKEITNAVPAFLTIIMMVLSYSITKGIGIGMISYVIISSLVYVVDLVKYAIDKKNGEVTLPKYSVSIVSIVVCALFLVYFLVPVTL